MLCMGKRMDTRICITDSLCYTPETNTTLLVNATPIKLKQTNKQKGIALGANEATNSSIYENQLCTKPLLKPKAKCKSKQSISENSEIKIS